MKSKTIITWTTVLMYQALDMKRWKTVIKPQVFDILTIIVEKATKDAKEPDDVPRGDSIKNLVLQISYDLVRGN